MSSVLHVPLRSFRHFAPPVPDSYTEAVEWARNHHLRIQVRDVKVAADMIGKTPHTVIDVLIEAGWPWKPVIDAEIADASELFDAAKRLGLTWEQISPALSTHGLVPENFASAAVHAGYDQARAHRAFHTM